MYENLKSNGLIELVNPKDIPGFDKQKNKAGFGFKTTLKGEKIHRAVIDAVYSELIKIKTSNL